jgi:hypothetical protein
MKAKWVNIVDSLPRNEEDIKDRYIEISKYRDIEGEKKRITTPFMPCVEELRA